MADGGVVGDTPIPVPAGAAGRWGVDPKAARPLGDGLVAVAVPQIWVEVPFEAWTAAYRLAVQGGALVIAELRLFPGGAARAADEPIGLWAGEALGAGATVPAGGLTSRLIKRLRLGEHHRHHARVLQRLAAEGRGDLLHPGDLVERMGVTPTSPAGPRRGRRPLDQL